MLFTALRSGNFTTIIVSLLASVFIIFCVVPLHECAHAWVAYKMGDNTAKVRGRLTLNPLVHINPIGAIMLVLVGFGWGNPCPIDERNFKNPKLGIALSSAAGPLSNLLLAWLLIFISVIVERFVPIMPNSFGMAVYFFLYYAAEISIFLAVFNLLPIPPLDGFRVLSVFLSDKAYYKMMQNQQIISLIIMVLIFSGALSTPLSWLAGYIYDFFHWLSALPF